MKSLLKFAFLVIAVLIVLSFIGVQPLSAYKDTSIQAVKSVIGQAKIALASATRGLIGSHFDVEIVDAQFQNAQSSLSQLFDSSVHLVAPKTGLPIRVKVKPTSSFTGEPFETRQVGSDTTTHSQPVWVLLYSKKDGYLFGREGPLTWTKSELTPVDESSVRNYDYLEAAKDKGTKGVIFSVDGKDKDIVAMRQEIEQYLTEYQTESWKEFFSTTGGIYGDIPSQSEQEKEVNDGFLKIINSYLRVEVADKDKVESLIEQEWER